VVVTFEQCARLDSGQMPDQYFFIPAGIPVSRLESYFFSYLCKQRVSGYAGSIKLLVENKKLGGTFKVRKPLVSVDDFRAAARLVVVESATPTKMERLTSAITNGIGTTKKALRFQDNYYESLPTGGPHQHSD
jgi:hypothetical protein